MAKDLAHFHHIHSSQNGPGATYQVFHGPSFAAQSTRTLLLTRDAMVAIPFLTGDGGPIMDVAVNVFTARANAEGRVAFYRNVAEGPLRIEAYPAQLIADAGSFDLTTTGVKTNSIWLPTSANDLWWFTFVANSLATMPNLVAEPCFYNVDAWGVGSQSGAGGFSDNRAALTIVRSMGEAWPATFPVSATAIRGQNVPLIAVRFGV